MIKDDEDVQSDISDVLDMLENVLDKYKDIDEEEMNELKKYIIDEIEDLYLIYNEDYKVEYIKK